MIAPQSTGRSFWSGLACHIWSIMAAGDGSSTGTWSRARSGATVTAVFGTMSWTMSCCRALAGGGRRGARDFLRFGRFGLVVEAPVILLTCRAHRKPAVLSLGSSINCRDHTGLASVF